MSVIELPLPVNEAGSYDVIVIGGGPAGVAAAAAAGREGARTLLIEAGSVLGGSGTAALVPAWCPFSDKQKVIHRGLAEVVLNRCKEHQRHVPKEQVDWVPIDAELLKRVYDDLAAEHGVQVLFQTMLAAVQTDGRGTVESVIVTNKHGLSRFRATNFIDCTGDADLCAWAGAEFHKGADSGEMMPATHCFILSSVEQGLFQTKYEGGRRLMGNHPATPIYEIINSGRYPLISDAHVCCNLIGPNTVGFNAGHLWGVDNTDPESVSQALAMGRKLAMQFRDALAEYCPDAFGQAYLVSTGAAVGIRETRRIIGEYILSIDDYLERRSFEDEICRNAYYIDIHHSQEEAQEHTRARSDCLSAPSLRYEAGESHGIPLRCLIPKGLGNVMAAGRSISCDRLVQGSVRVMPTCLTMGEAAGMASAIAAACHAGKCRDLDISQLRCRLKAAGAYLPDV